VSLRFGQLPETDFGLRRRGLLDFGFQVGRQEEIRVALYPVRAGVD
jgi:hypothetical protein